MVARVVMLPGERPAVGAPEPILAPMPMQAVQVEAQELRERQVALVAAVMELGVRAGRVAPVSREPQEALAEAGVEVQGLVSHLVAALINS